MYSAGVDSKTNRMTLRIAGCEAGRGGAGGGGLGGAARPASTGPAAAVVGGCRKDGARNMRRPTRGDRVGARFAEDPGQEQLTERVGERKANPVRRVLGAPVNAGRAA